MVCFAPVRFGVQLTFRAIALRQSKQFQLPLLTIELDGKL